jgi:DNA helicase-2/ATP-dependent DNA helicase PcrA
VAKELGVEGSWEQFLSDMERLKNLGVLPEGDLAKMFETYDPQSPYIKFLHQAYHLYERKLARYDALDFTDLLLKAILVIEQHPEVLEHLRNRYRYILVDEYQDTCPLQERLLRILSGRTIILCGGR